MVIGSNREGGWGAKGRWWNHLEGNPGPMREGSEDP